MNNYEDEIDFIIDQELNNSNVNKYIEQINPNIDLKYNSLNIAVGKPGTSKTTTFMKTMMKVCQVPNNYHMILYVSDLEVDDTINSLMKYITIPMIKVTYNQFLDTFEKLIKSKNLYWQAFREKNKKLVMQYAKQLYIKNPSYNIQTMILCDDASWIFSKSSPLIKHLNKLRHYQCTFWLNIHVWKSIPVEMRGLITSTYICRGFSRQILQNIIRQLATSEPFEKIFRIYNSLVDYEKLFIDNQDSIIKIIS